MFVYNKFKLRSESYLHTTHTEKFIMQLIVCKLIEFYEIRRYDTSTSCCTSFQAFTELFGIDKISNELLSPYSHTQKQFPGSCKVHINDLKFLITFIKVT